MVERRTPNPDAGGSSPSWPAILDYMMEKIKKFLREVRSEIKKVTWTGRKEVTSGTVAVVVLSSIISLFLWGADFLLSQLIRLVLGM